MSNWITEIRQFDKPKLIVNCSEIILKQNKIEITINHDKIKDVDTIVIDGKEYNAKKETLE